MKMARVLLRFLPALLLVACRTAPPASPTPAGTSPDSSASMRVLAKGEYGAAASGDSTGGRPQVVVARSAAAYQRFWSQHINAEVPPAVDFSRELVVFLLLGRQSSGGHSITPTGTTTEGEVATVDSTVEHPAKRAMVSMALTAPYAVVALPRGEYRVVRWRSGEELLATEGDGGLVDR